MRGAKMIIGSLLLTLLIGFHSCRPQKPDLIVSKGFDFIEDKNNSPIRALTIEQYDTGNNFIGKKNIYKNSDNDGKSKIYFFTENGGYHFNGDTLRLGRGFVYKLYIKTLGFADTLVLKP
jgi:hypothetical protein